MTKWLYLLACVLFAGSSGATLLVEEHFATAINTVSNVPGWTTVAKFSDVNTHVTNSALLTGGLSYGTTVSGINGLKTQTQDGYVYNPNATAANRLTRPLAAPINFSEGTTLYFSAIVLGTKRANFGLGNVTGTAFPSTLVSIGMQPQLTSTEAAGADMFYASVWMNSTSQLGTNTGTAVTVPDSQAETYLIVGELVNNVGSADSISYHVINLTSNVAVPSAWTDSALAGEAGYYAGAFDFGGDQVYSNLFVMLQNKCGMDEIYVGTSYTDVIPESVQSYALTVNGGTGGGSYTNGAQIAIAANIPPPGEVFDQWTGDTQYVSSVTSATATVTMPATTVGLTATYKTASVYYTLTVSGGSGSGSYTNGAQVAIVADAPLAGMTFDMWTGDTQYVDSVTSSNATVTMTTNAVTLSSSYKDLVYTLTGNADVNGTVTPSGTNVVYGNSADFVITASNYYRIASLTTNGTAVIGMTFDNGSTTTNFTWTGVLADGTVAATFTAQVATDPAGTPYSWLAGYGLTNYDADAVADQDADGLKAWQEYIAGTDPTSKASCLKVAQTNRNTVTWSPVAGRVYSVYWSTNMVKGFTNLASGIQYPQGSYTNTTPDAKVNHYQVQVQLQ